MRNYEVAFIAHPDVNEQALTALTEKVHGWITGAGGTIARTTHWGKRRLAYPIRKQHDGHYVFIYTSMPSTVSAELERQLRISEEVLRFMVTLAEPPAAAIETPPPAAGASDKEADKEVFDEDSEEDE